MNILPGRSAVAGGVRTVLVFAIVMIFCDAWVALTAYESRRSFVAAPSNASVVPADDPTYFVAGLAYAATSAVRYLVLVGLVVAILLCRPHRHPYDERRPGVNLRLRIAIAGVLVGIDLVYVVATWSKADPSGGWFLLRASILLISAVASATTCVIVLRRAESGIRRNADIA